MVRQKLRPHQREAVDAAVRALELPAGRRVPQSGLRTQVIMATGSGKSLVAVHTAEELRAGRVLVLVPSLDLLVQTAAAWREGGRTGRAFAVCSLRGEDAGVPTTTDPAELAGWAGPPVDRVTVYATYASLGLGTIERAHREGLPGWDLIVVDEAHRTSGRIGKPWAVVHDNTRIPSVRRLYMTATPGSGRTASTPRAPRVQKAPKARRTPRARTAPRTPKAPTVSGRVVAGATSWPPWRTTPTGRSARAATP